jgi:hypothetical protein
MVSVSKSSQPSALKRITTEKTRFVSIDRIKTLETLFSEIAVGFPYFLPFDAADLEALGSPRQTLAPVTLVSKEWSAFTVRVPERRERRDVG